jgi:hypothetical protein
MATQDVKKEELKHKKAFEVYYSLGEKRSTRATAKKVGVSPGTIQNWSKSFNWAERVEIRDATVGEALEQKAIDTVVTLKADYHKIIKATIFAAIERIKSGELRIENVNDLRMLVQLDLDLLGEEDRRNKGQMDAMTNAIQASLQMFGGSVYDGKARIEDEDVLEPEQMEEE